MPAARRASSAGGQVDRCCRSLKSTQVCAEEAWTVGEDACSCLDLCVHTTILNVSVSSGLPSPTICPT